MTLNSINENLKQNENFMQTRNRRQLELMGSYVACRQFSASVTSFCIFFILFFIIYSSSLLDPYHFILLLWFIWRIKSLKQVKDSQEEFIWQYKNSSKMFPKWVFIGDLFCVRKIPFQDNKSIFVWWLFCCQCDVNGLYQLIFQEKVMFYHKMHQQHSPFDVSVVCLLNILLWAAYNTIKTELNFDHKSVSPKEIRSLG